MGVVLMSFRSNTVISSACMTEILGRGIPGRQRGVACDRRGDHRARIDVPRVKRASRESYL